MWSHLLQFVQLFINYFNLINELIFYFCLFIINLLFLLFILHLFKLFLSNYLIFVKIPIVLLDVDQLTNFILVPDHLLCLLNTNLFLPELLLYFFCLMEFGELIKHAFQGIHIHQHVISLRFNKLSQLRKQRFALLIRNLLSCQVLFSGFLHIHQCFFFEP